ncbi:hypothetical protein ACJJIQ_00025 (plasmid) [Microbulbifer sp. ANSA003]|uniref:hypothetical protein n=1 Tax=Microbulbifer sp. ANSA003 TaxID=3243360 RepID=UPI0040420A45
MSKKANEKEPKKTAGKAPGKLEFIPRKGGSHTRPAPELTTREAADGNEKETG